MAVALHACLLQVAFYVKARLCRSQMTREKQGEGAEKVMLMGMNPLKNSLLFKQFGYCSGISLVFLI